MIKYKRFIETINFQGKLYFFTNTVKAKKHTVNARYEIIALKAIKSITFSEKKNQTTRANIGKDAIDISLESNLYLYEVSKNNSPNNKGHIWVSLEFVPKFTHGKKAKNRY